MKESVREILEKLVPKAWEATIIAPDRKKHDINISLKAIREKVLEMRELHTHNSIPTYIDESGNGCMDCDRNAVINEIASMFK